VPWTVADKYWAPGPNAPFYMTKKGEVFLDAVPRDAEQTDAAILQIKSMLRLRGTCPRTAATTSRCSATTRS
jgi:hypothetical protein